MHVALSDDQEHQQKRLIENPLRYGVYKIVLELHENEETEFHFWKIKTKEVIQMKEEVI